MTFEKWFEEYFCNQQGEDSPYRYDDVKEAYEQGKKDEQKRILLAWENYLNTLSFRNLQKESKFEKELMKNGN